MVINPDDHAEFEMAEEIHDRLIERALRLGGTCSGEPALVMENGIYAVGARQCTRHDGTPKRALDPGNIMNPGKVLP